MKYAIIIFLYCFGIVFLMPAQGTKQTMSLTDLYALADSQSKTIKIFETAVSYAEQEISVARNAYLPNIDFSASASYNDNAWVSDRDFTNGQNFVSPHFGNNFAIEASQVVFAGGSIYNTIKAREIEKKIAEWDLSEQRQEVYFLLTGYYLDHGQQPDGLRRQYRGAAHQARTDEDRLSSLRAAVWAEGCNSPAI